MKSKFFKILALAAIPLMFAGCSSNNYNDNNFIANEDARGTLKFSTMNLQPSEDCRQHGKIGELDGIRKVAQANIDKDQEVALHISFAANSGKGKLVLVKPNSEVEVLAEVTSEKGSEHFEGNVVVKCIPGVNKIKIVGENYGGDFEIYQPNGVIFKSVNMLGENFPFEK